MKKSIANSTILAVFPADEDRTSLINIFAQSGWNVGFTGVPIETQRLLLRSSVDVVISDSRLSDGYCWQDLLREMQEMEEPPPLIVADRLADERLWAEVLNLGAFDLLAKPFNSTEVLYAVAAACQHSENQRQFAAPHKATKGARHKSVTGLRAYTSGAA